MKFSAFRKGCPVTAVLALVLLFFSCSKTKPSYNRENLKADWVVDVYDGEVVDPDRWMVYSFDKSGTLDITGIQNTGDGSCTWGSCSLKYEAYCCDMSYSGDVKGFFGIPITVYIEREYSFFHSEDSLMTLELKSEKMDGEVMYSDHNRLTMRKLSPYYSATDSIAGIWQTSTRDGEKFESWRMWFYGDGTFEMFVQSGSGKWDAAGDGGEFMLYDDFAAVTVTDNPYIGTSGATDVVMMTGIEAFPSLSMMSMVIGGELFTFTFVADL